MLNAEEITKRLKRLVPDGMPIEIPPKVFLEMEGEFVSYDPDTQSLVARFPNLPRFHNPVGHMQGGVIATLVDNTIGPLSYLAAPISVTTQLNTSYIRPVTGEDAYVEIKGYVVEKTKSQLFLEAVVSNPSGKQVARASATCRIIG